MLFFNAHVKISNKVDELIWFHSKRGIYNPKEGYLIVGGRIVYGR